MKKTAWILFGALAIMVGLYPIIYFVLDPKFGLLSTKTEELLTDFFWNLAFYIHIIPGGIALLLGWTQFSPRLRNNKLNLHRKIGKLYVIAALFSAIGSAYIAWFATGGIISTIGFLSLALIWFYTTIMAYIHIKNRRIEQHRKMMHYSYAACFAAVTLRLWLPLFVGIIGDFFVAYRIIAWWCWIPNILIAWLLIRRTERQNSRSDVSAPG